MSEQSRKDVLKSALYEGVAIETAPIACTDPECGHVYQYMINAETETWDEVPDYVECGNKGHPDPDNELNWIEDPCPAPAKVFKDDSELRQSDKTPVELANELYQKEAGDYE